MDDDIYIRPLVLRFLLTHLSKDDSNHNYNNDNNNNNNNNSVNSRRMTMQSRFESATGEEMALIAASKYRNLQYSNRWNSSVHPCGVPDVFDFPLAQPAFLNRCVFGCNCSYS